MHILFKNLTFQEIKKAFKIIKAHHITLGSTQLNNLLLKSF